jgi:hypothetical protein
LTTIRGSFAPMSTVDPDDPLIGLQSFALEMKAKLSDYADRAEKIANAKWNRNQLPSDVQAALHSLPQEFREMPESLRNLAVKLGPYRSK